ncbi:MAG: CopG family transcriptional regulator [Candidatus Methanomethylicota archaeon]|uniref:CopG family transcriptional regulator n=1 Tax=Thermoproteota archaeon TaxID=2056631 RepID=A0A497F286_9CREN|nr:MAG: CopG family transcriptional regulator [Candidatus Verstraetearchaeota archaeon]
MSEDKIAVYITRELYDKIAEQVEKSHGVFKSVDEYVNFALKELLEKEESNVFTPEEEEEIKKRLRSLGYIA